MLLKCASFPVTLFATCALFSLASPANNFTWQVTQQDSSLALNPDDTYSSQEPVPSPKSQYPQVNIDAAIFFGIEKGKTHQFLGIPFAYPP